MISKGVLNRRVCRPSLLCPDSRASNPSSRPSIFRFPHFQQKYKSVLYGPARAYCAPDGLLKVHITQRGHHSLRDTWSKRDRRGSDGQTLSHLLTTHLVCQPACFLWLNAICQCWQEIFKTTVVCTSSPRVLVVHSLSGFVSFSSIPQSLRVLPFSCYHPLPLKEGNSVFARVCVSQKLLFLR